jgi:hypothetical protein
MDLGNMADQTLFDRRRDPVSGAKMDNEELREWTLKVLQEPVPIRLLEAASKLDKALAAQRVERPKPKLVSD